MDLPLCLGMSHLVIRLDDRMPSFSSRVATCSKDLDHPLRGRPHPSRPRDMLVVQRGVRARFRTGP